MLSDNLCDDVLDYIVEATIQNNFDLVVFVEDEDDKRFWNFIFKQSKKDLKLFYIPYSKSGAKGKKEILKYKDCLSKQAIICMDADYDYILENENTKKDFIFHTYVYAVENYCCCAKSLNDLLLMLNLDTNFNFDEFFIEYSKIIKEFLILDICLSHSGKTLKDNFKFNHFNYDREDLTTENILEFIEQNINNIQKDEYNVDSDLLEKIKLKIENDDYIKDNYLHLYVSGHTIFDSILKLLQEVQKRDTNTKIKEIKNGFSDEKIGEKINELKNKELDKQTLLRANFEKCFYENYCPSLNQIIEDIKEKI